MQYCRDDSESFKFKSRFTNNTDDAVTVTVELAGPLKYLVILENSWNALNQLWN